MSCEDFRDSFELYSLGLLEGEEKTELESHLEQGCATCRRQINDAFAVKALMLSQAPDVVPPSRLRRRVVASVGGQGFSWTWMATAAAAAMLVVTLWFSLQARGREQELQAARQTLQQTTAERDRLELAFPILEEPGTRNVNFGQTESAPPRGNIYLNPRLGVLLIAANLPALDSARTYQMWLIPPGGAPRPAGLFQASADGSAIHVLPGQIDLTQVGAVAVSVEPAAGSQAPTTTPIIVAAAGA